MRRKKKRDRKTPHKHIVHTKHPRYHIKTYERGKGSARTPSRPIVLLSNKNRVRGRYRDKDGNIKLIPKNWSASASYRKSLGTDKDGIVIWPQNTYTLLGYSYTLKYKGEPLDLPIAETVLHLRRRGLDTIQSCGGHFKAKEYTYAGSLPLSKEELKNRYEWSVTPDGWLRSWVGFGASDKEFKKLRKALEPLIREKKIRLLSVKDGNRHQANISIPKNTRHDTHKAVSQLNKVLRR